MRALQYRTHGGRPELVEVDKPAPGPGQVLLNVTAAGACHSDEFIMAAPEGTYQLPLTLGHEGAGVVEALGPGVSGVSVGDSVLVYGPWGCGRCYFCAQGKENDCQNGVVYPGISRPGAMADHMLVDDARSLVRLGDLDPGEAVSLTDAGLTPYHAVKPALHRLVPGSTAVVIGAGGLGHVGIQLVRALSAATVIALDIADDKLELAKEVGAHHVLRSDAAAVDGVRQLTDGRGAEVVFDYVGAQPTLDIAKGIVAVEGEIAIVGVAQGSIPVGYLTMPWDSSVRVVNWGTRPELIEVVELARSGAIRIAIERFSLADGPRAYERLHAGTVKGRAVVIP